jgi:hypothetical protein
VTTAHNADDNSPTVLRILLGAHLRRLREATTITRVSGSRFSIGRTARICGR